MIRQVFSAIFAAILLLPSGAHAEITLKSYNEYKKSEATKDRINEYLIGVGKGIFWANAGLEFRANQKLFCMPPKLAPDGGLILSLLEQEIRTPGDGDTYKEDTPVELILVRAFETRFPCSGDAA